MTQAQAASEAGHERRCEERNCLIASAILVDSRGWLLLQERDEHAPVAPNQWGLVGGHLEPGEGWEAGFRRELMEETGLRLETEPELWFDEVVQHTPKVSTHLADRWRVWVAKVDLTDDDISVGEGRQIVFVDPAKVTSDSLDMSPGSGYVVGRFLESDSYRAMR